jgi:hypothetical protein
MPDAYLACPGCWSAGWDAVTTDTLLADKPVHVLAVVVTPNTNVSALARLVDGRNALASRSFRIGAAADLSTALVFTAPLLFSNGLFIDLDANTREVMVQYHVMDESPTRTVEEAG